MDPLWAQHLENLLNQDEECLTCPHCKTLNPIHLLTANSKYTPINKNYDSFLFKTVICSFCQWEWIPSSIQKNRIER